MFFHFHASFFGRFTFCTCLQCPPMDFTRRWIRFRNPRSARCWTSSTFIDVQEKWGLSVPCRIRPFIRDAAIMLHKDRMFTGTAESIFLRKVFSQPGFLRKVNLKAKVIKRDVVIKLFNIMASLQCINIILFLLFYFFLWWRDHLEAAGHTCILKDAFRYEGPSEIANLISAEKYEAALAIHLYKGGRLLQGNPLSI